MDTLSPNFVQMLIRFVICMVVNFVIIDRLYYPKGRRRDYYFTYMITSVAIFFLMFFMMDMKAKATLGIGIGLFGIFSIMRFRTDAMPVREMTYLFLIISLSVITAVAPVGDGERINPSGIIELLITDLIVLVITAICEKMIKTSPVKLIRYDRPELTLPDRREELMADLTRRTGLEITKIEVGGYDFLRDAVVLKVHYNADNEHKSNSVDGQFGVRRNIRNA
ncbi:MAG: DUF4956 domain-containing protein [Prevotella sp.]|nr:DUF4956 domain-containing protein [Prevotella sp.]